MSSRMAGAVASPRVFNFFLRLLCIVKKRPVHACRRWDTSFCISASISGRSVSDNRRTSLADVGVAVTVVAVTVVDEAAAVAIERREKK